MELIVNVTKNWGIGFENRLLVSISADLRRFRQLTEGKTVILGRKTLETFPGGRPLKNRRNILLTANPALRVDGADIVHSEEALFARLRTLPRETLCPTLQGGKCEQTALYSVSLAQEQPYATPD